MNILGIPRDDTHCLELWAGWELEIQREQILPNCCLERKYQLALAREFRLLCILPNICPSVLKVRPGLVGVS